MPAHVDSGDEGVAGRGNHSSGEDARRRGLACTVRSEEAEDLTLMDSKVQSINRWHVHSRVRLRKVNGSNDFTGVDGHGSFRRFAIVVRSSGYLKSLRRPVHHITRSVSKREASSSHRGFQRRVIYSGHLWTEVPVQNEAHVEAPVDARDHLNCD